MSGHLKERTGIAPQFKLEWRETDVFDIRGLLHQKEGWLTWNKETERMVVKKAAIHAHKFRFTDPDSFVGDVLIHAYRKISCYKIEHKNGIDRLCRNYAISVTRKKTLNTMSYDALNHAADDDETFESIFHDKERDLVEEIHTRDVLLEVQEQFPVFFRSAAMKADGIPDFEIAKDMGMSPARFKRFYAQEQARVVAWMKQRHKE